MEKDNKKTKTDFEKLSDKIKEVKEKEKRTDLTDEERKELAETREKLVEQLKRKLERTIISLQKYAEELSAKQKEFRKQLTRVKKELNKDKERLEELQQNPEENKQEIALLEQKISDNENLIVYYDKVYQEASKALKDCRSRIRKIQKDYEEYLPEELKPNKKTKKTEVDGPDVDEPGSEGPGNGPEGPGNGPERPGDGPEGPGDGPEGPGDGPEGPGDGPEGPGDALDEKERKERIAELDTEIRHLQEDIDRVNDEIDATRDDKGKAKLIKLRDELNEQLNSLKKQRNAISKENHEKAKESDDKKGSKLPAKTFEQIVEESCSEKVGKAASLFRNLRNIDLRNEKGNIKASAIFLAIPKAFGYFGDLALGGDRTSCNMYDTIKNMSEEDFEVLRSGLEADPSKKDMLDPVYISAVESRAKEKDSESKGKTFGDAMSSLVKNDLDKDTAEKYINDYERESPDENYYI